MNCPYCGNPIPPRVNNCPSCGAPVEIQEVPVNPQINSGTFAHSLWMSITSMVTGLLCFFASLDDSDWDEDSIAGFMIFFLISVIAGIVVCCKEKNRKNARGMAIAGIVLSVLALLIA